MSTGARVTENSKDAGAESRAEENQDQEHEYLFEGSEDRFKTGYVYALLLNHRSFSREHCSLNTIKNAG